MGTFKKRLFALLVMPWLMAAEPASALHIESLAPCESWPGGEQQTWCMRVSGMQGRPARVVFNGSVLPTSAVSRQGATLRFSLAQGQKTSGPVWVSQGRRSSNAVWLTLRPSRVLSVSSEHQVRLSDRVVTALDLVSLIFQEGVDGLAQARRVARQYGVDIVGAIAPLNVYQVRLPVSDLAARDALVAALKTDPVIVGVVVEDDNPEVPRDPDRVAEPADEDGWVANRFFPAVELYRQYVASASSNPNPGTVVIGVVEKAVNFDTRDFASYLRPCSTEHTCLYARHSVQARHGTFITGLLAAGRKPVDHLGFLSQLGAAGGRFKIIVDRGSLAGVIGRVAASVNMVEDGAHVLNWSWGIHRMGTTNLRGERVETNVRSDLAFNGYEQLLKRFFRWLERSHPNVVVVNSSGNSFSTTDEHLPASLQSPQLLVVGAHQRSRQGANIREPHFVTMRKSSNIGQRVDITAAACPQRTSSRSRTEVRGHCGTSYAAALVTGTVAAMLAVDPALEPGQIRALLRRSALPLAARDEEQRQGIGLTSALTPAEHALAADSEAEVYARLNMQGALALVIKNRDGAPVVESHGAKPSVL